MIYKRPTVGMKVRVNNFGLSQLHLTTIEEFNASQNLTITNVENLGYPDSPVWAIGVDNPEINKFMLEIVMFDEIK